MEIGYWLSSEEHAPARRSSRTRKLAEEAGFEHVLISDHIHPWVDAQGHSPFVWGVIGAIAEATERIRLGTAVTCPLIRMHPAIVAHAAATAQALMDGRFFLGVGTGENLNEHVLGDRWPRADERLEMLDEAIDVIRKLFGGDYETYRGKHYTVEQAKLYDAPSDPPPIIVAAQAENAAKLAAREGRRHDEHDARRGDREGLQGGRRQGADLRQGRPAASPPSDGDARRRSRWSGSRTRRWAASSRTELALPRDFEAVAELVREEDLEGSLVLGDDPAEWREKIDEFERAGFTHVCLHDVADEPDASSSSSPKQFA